MNLPPWMTNRNRVFLPVVLKWRGALRFIILLHPLKSRWPNYTQHISPQNHLACHRSPAQSLMLPRNSILCDMAGSQEYSHQGKAISKLVSITIFLTNDATCARLAAHHLVQGFNKGNFKSFRSKRDAVEDYRFSKVNNANSLDVVWLSGHDSDDHLCFIKVTILMQGPGPWHWHVSDKYTTASSNNTSFWIQIFPNMADRDLIYPHLSASHRATQASHTGFQILQDNLSTVNQSTCP